MENKWGFLQRIARINRVQQEVWCTKGGRGENLKKKPNQLNKQTTHGRESSLVCKEYSELRPLNGMLKARVQFPVEGISTKSKTQQAPGSACELQMTPSVKAEPLPCLLLFDMANVYEVDAIQEALPFSLFTVTSSHQRLLSQSKAVSCICKVMTCEIICLLRQMHMCSLCNILWTGASRIQI